MAGHAKESQIPSLIINFFNQARKSSFYSNAFYLMLNSAATSLLGFVFWNLMARFFQPAEVGIGSALVSACGLVGALSNLGLGAGLVRFVPEAGEKAGRLINASFTLAGGLALAGALIYLAGVKYWSPPLGFVREGAWFLILFGLFSVTTALSILADQSLVAGRAASYVFWKNTLISLLKLPLPVFLFRHLGGFGIFAATGLATAAGVLLALLRFLPGVFREYFFRPVFGYDVLGPVFSFTLGNYLASLFNSAIGFVLPLLVLNLLGPEASAYFYITWMMNGVIGIIAGGTASSLFAEGAHAPENLAAQVLSALKVSLLLLILAAGLMIVSAPWLLGIFGPAYAENGTGLIRVLVLANFPQAVNLFFLTINQVRKKVNLIILQTGATAGLTLSLGYLLLGRFGLTGAGIAYALAHFTVAVVVVWPLLRALREQETAGKQMA